MVAKLWSHQQNAVDLALKQDTFALLMDPGVGKSGTSVRILAERMNQNKRNLRTIIFCPPVVVSNWAREIQKFSEIESSKVALLVGSGQERLEILKKRKAHIYICNWQSLLMKPLFDEMKKFAPEFIIWDESHLAKNPTAIRSKKAAELSDLAKYKLILTGTPVTNSAMDLYMQFRILDSGATFGKNFFQFRAQFFYDANSKMPAHLHFPSWQLKPGSLDKFNEIIRQRGVVAKKEDCLDLPDLVCKRVEVPMSPKQAKAYQAMKQDFIAFMEKDKVAVAQLAITKALRLQQITSGFVKTEDDSEVVFEDNPRLDALKEILEEIFASGAKCVIWAIFKNNYKQIRKLLDSIGVKHTELHGEVSDTKRQSNIDAFNNEEDVRAIISHPGSGGVGCNLIAASYSVYFSRGFSLEHQLQSQARNYRGGSAELHKKITKIDLVCPNTIDDLILERLSNKQGISDKVLREIVEELKNDK